MSAWKSAPLLLSTLLFSSLPSASSPVEHEVELAHILKLEDRRSTGAGALLSYLDPGRPLDIRIRAALACGRIGSPVTTPYHLLGALEDRSAELRRMAVFALGEMDDVKAAPLLAAALGDPDSQVRGLAAEALGKLKDPASVETLMARLHDTDGQVVGMTLYALWKIEPGGRLADQVKKASTIAASARGELLRQAVYFLMRAQMGHTDDETISEALLVHRRDADPLVRSYVARGLGASKSGRSTEALLELAADADWRVRINAFNGLKTRPVPQTPQTRQRWGAYEAALSGSDSGVALAALASLESLALPEAQERLAGYLAHNVPRYREVAAVALAARDHAGSLERLRPLGSDPHWSVRARLAEALGAIATQDTLAGLQRLAADADPRVRSVAVEQVAKIDYTAAAAAVEAALDDQDLFVRAAALEALGRISAPGGVAVVPKLIEGYRTGLRDVHNDARLAALGAMAALPSDASRTGVEAALSDPDYLVRRRAAELLRDTFKMDGASKVGEPATARTDADYREAVRRGGRRVTAELETAAGVISVELFPADAPLTVDNFIRLAREGKLDNLVFHRVVPNFVIQDGDPRGDGNGGPEWQIRCEINQKRYAEGAVGMALSGKDTGGSQYFITHSPQPHLDGGYTVFGHVISGQDVVNGIVQGDLIRKVRIEESSVKP